MTKEFEFDEEQEELDFVRPRKRIPVTLTVSGYDKLMDLASAIENDDSGYWTNKRISSALKNISSIKPQERTGHWIDTGSGQECSECHEIQYGYDNHRFYCGNCGAKIEVENNG